MSRHPLQPIQVDPTLGQDCAIEPIDEVLDAISAEIARCAARANDHARLLESTGSLAFNVSAEIHRNDAPCDLLQRAHGLQSLVSRGLNLLADLQSEAGRLESLAVIKGAVPDEAQ